MDRGLLPVLGPTNIIPNILPFDQPRHRCLETREGGTACLAQLKPKDFLARVLNRQEGKLTLFYLIPTNPTHRGSNTRLFLSCLRTVLSE